MFHGDGPPPIFEGDDFSYWKIRMEAYLEALDVGVLRAASQGFPKPKDPVNLQGDEVNYDTTKNTLIHDGLLWSQTSENTSQLTHDDDQEKRHVSHVIHLLNQNGLSQISFFCSSWISCLSPITSPYPSLDPNHSDEKEHHKLVPNLHSINHTININHVTH